MFSSLSNGYEDLWKAIIRPPRDDYNISELGLMNKLDYLNNFKAQLNSRYKELRSREQIFN